MKVGEDFFSEEDEYYRMKIARLDNILPEVLGVIGYV